MPVYFFYMLKATACLAVIYLFYALLLRNITYYSWNRFVLLVYCILACIIPSVNVIVPVNTTRFELALFDQLPVLSPSYAVTESPIRAGVGIADLLSGIFLLGVFIMLLRLIIQLVSLWKMHSKAVLLQDGKVKIYHIDEPIIPFSYFNNIYLNKLKYSNDELTEIVNHELVHVQQKHAIDILLSELLCILNWYNPVVWLLKKAIRENLEYIADDMVIKNGADRKHYQYLLLKVTGNVSFSVANSLNVSSLKNRISMINKAKTSSLHLLRFAVFIPVAGITLLSFRNKQEVFSSINNTTEQVSKIYKLGAVTYAIPDKNIEAAVKKEQDKSFLITGKPINLDPGMFLNEQARLKKILEKSGYNVEQAGYSNTGQYGIIFMVDTTLGNNNLSVQVNIDLAKNNMLRSDKDLIRDREISTRITNIERSGNNPTHLFPEDDTHTTKNGFAANLFGIR